MGIISTSRIGLNKVIPALQKGKYTNVTAIASRDSAKAHSESALLTIPKAYASYEELLADKEIETIYIPLPSVME